MREVNITEMKRLLVEEEEEKDRIAIENYKKAKEELRSLIDKAITTMESPLDEKGIRELRAIMNGGHYAAERMYPLTLMSQEARKDPGYEYGWRVLEGIKAYWGVMENRATVMLEVKPFTLTYGGLSVEFNSLWVGILRGKTIWEVRIYDSPDGGGAYPHPHVNRSCEMCVGTFAERLREALSRNNMGLVYLTIVEALHSYNHHSPYKTLDKYANERGNWCPVCGNWLKAENGTKRCSKCGGCIHDRCTTGGCLCGDKRPLCDRCRAEVDRVMSFCEGHKRRGEEYKWCHHRGMSNCGLCHNLLHSSEKKYCSEHGKECPSCKSYVCLRHWDFKENKCRLCADTMGVVVKWSQVFKITGETIKREAKGVEDGE